MIEKLTLTGFGKFKEAVFGLAGVTLVYGPNEAGKTTFFDALFQAICRPSETKKSGKVLKARYGAGRGALAEPLPVPISDEEFLNLYAIREGDLRLELDKGTEWLEKLKSRLFHGGLDPSAFAAEFEKRSSDSRTLTHTRELEKAKATLDQARRELEAKKQERNSVLAREKKLAEAEAALQETRKLLRAGAEEAVRLESEIASEEKIALRRKWNGYLARLDEWQQSGTEAETLAPFRLDRREELKSLRDATVKAGAAIQAERGKRDQQTDLIAQAKVETRGMREAKEAAAIRSAAAAKLAASAMAYLAGKKPRGGLPVWTIAAMGLAIGLGGLGAAWLAVKLAVASAAAGVLLAVSAFILGSRAASAQARADAAAALARWKDEWNLVAGPGVAQSTALVGGASVGAVNLATPEGFLQAMETASREKENAEAREWEAARRLESLQDGLEKITATLAGLTEAEALAHRAEKDWLARYGVESAESYAERVSRCRQVDSDLGKRRAELETLAGGSDLNAFRVDLHRKLLALDEAGVPQHGQDEAALQRLRNRRREMLKEQEIVGGTERGMIADREGLAGEIRGAFGKLAGDMVAWEKAVADAEEEVAGKELDKRAAALALEIFRSIGYGADQVLAGLSGEMEAMLANILPAGRTVSLQGLEDRQIQVMDAGGGMRSLDQLSTGTRHAMVLAAKLAMARKHRPGPGLLVLDDPFLAMDDERETKAMEMLREFHVRHGWQIVLLTKSPPLAVKAEGIFPGLRRIDLAAFA